MELMAISDNRCIIDLLFRLAAVTGTIRILRGEGGVGGWVWTLFRLARKNPKTKRNKENRHFSEQITGNNRRKSHRSTRIPSVISWHSKIFGPAGHQLVIIYFIIIFQLLRLHDRL